MPTLFITILIISITACSYSGKLKQDKELKILTKLAESINEDLKSVQEDIVKLANGLYKIAFYGSVEWNPEIYNTSNNILSQANEDVNSAVYCPVNGTIPNNLKQIIVNSQQLDSYFLNILGNNSVLEQVYFLDTNSSLRIYPYVDIVKFIKEPIKLTNFITYQGTMNKPFNNNKAYWVNLPFADPYGRGWIISCSGPVDYRDDFIGIVSGDIHLKKIQDKYKLGNPEKYIIIHTKGNLIFSTKEASDFIAITPLREFQYYKPITENIFIFDKSSLIEHKNKKLGNAIKLLLSGEEKTSFLKGKKECTIYKSKIKEVNWLLLKIIT